VSLALISFARAEPELVTKTHGSDSDRRAPWPAVPLCNHCDGRGSTPAEYFRLLTSVVWQ